MTLVEKMKASIDLARAAIEQGDLESARKHRSDAETFKSAIEEANALSEIAIPEVKNMRPALPNSGKEAITEEKPVKSFGSRDVAYITRFGEEEAAIKGILTDLHGDYQGKFWAQKAAFRNYIRGGETALRSEDKAILSEVVMTPKVVKMALDQGVDDIPSYRATMNEASDVLGGYMVPVDFQLRVLERLAGSAVMRQFASTMMTSRDKVEFPEATGADGKYTSPVRVSWVDETPSLGSLASQNLTFGLRGIQVHTAMAEAPLSRNLIEDSAFDIEAYLSRKFAEAAGVDESRQFLLGNGIGKPTGMLPGAANTHGLVEVNSGNVSTMSWQGLVKMPFSIDAQYRGQKSIWIMNKKTLQQIALLTDASGNYLLQPYQYQGGTANPIGGMLLGYPVVEDEDMPDVAANAYPILFGDFTAYQIVDRIGMSIERHLDSATARQNLVYYVMRRRLGGQPVETWRMSTQKIAV